MSEELLKAIIQLFAIVARERITDDERNNIKEFLAQHLNRDSIKYYLDLFDHLIAYQVPDRGVEGEWDHETRLFVGDWSSIMQISKQVNSALTKQQKLVLIAKIIELVFADNELSERQNNLIFYVGQALKVPQSEVNPLRKFILGQDAEELSDKNILIIDEGSGEGVTAGPRMVAKNLTGLIALLRMVDAETYFIKYLGISTLYLNSLPLQSRKINVFPTGSTIRGNKIQPIYYSDIVSRFLSRGDQPKITFVANHIFYHFRSGRAGLQNINISEAGGKLIGIMGASGSGKSTLLNVLNGSEKPSSGKVVINGVDIHQHPEEVEGAIGFIPQDDLLIEDLTVFQNLYFAARLSLGKALPFQLFRLVKRVLVNLGLTEISNLKVGSPLNKTISGGQRKRLNIGLELLREPAVLFVDEPTSGLSSRDSENIMDLLKELALRGKMVFVVLHQPSSDIFKMFDTLVILDVGGFQIYHGNPIEAAIYFKEIVNAANKHQGACPECGNINPEQIFNIIETKVVNEYGRLTKTRKISPGEWYQYFKEKIKIPKTPHAPIKLSKTLQIPSRLKQLQVFIERDILAKVANKQYLYINLLQAPLLAFFISFMVRYYNILDGEHAAYTFYYNQNIPVYFFMSVIVALFFGLTLSAEEIFRDRKILRREQYLNLSRNSYLLSKVAVLFTISAMQTISFLLVGNWVLEIPLGEFRYVLILFSTACFANMLGLNISSAFNSAVTIYILIPVLIIPQLLLSGVVINFDKFNPNVGTPVGIPWMGELMASRWAFEAYMVTQFRDNSFEQQFYELDKKFAISEYKRVYYIPQLESKLAYCLNQRAHWRNPSHEKLNASLDILKREIESELRAIGEEQFPQVHKLTIAKFDSAVYQETSRFLTILKQYYTNKVTDAAERTEELENTLRDSLGIKAYEKWQRSNVNEVVAASVKNEATPHRIVEYNGQFEQLIYPIYLDEHKPKHILDFTSNLYQPTKHFLGTTWDTLFFNIAVIWAMTAALYVTLYFNILNYIIESFERKRKYRKKE